MKIGRILKFIMFLPLLFPSFAQSFVQARNSKSSTNAMPACDGLPVECDSFNIEEGAINARFVILAEYHDRGADTVKCIEKLAKGKDKHTIYIEGIEKGQEVDCNKIKGFKNKPGRRCVGWDGTPTQKKLLDDSLVALQQTEYLLRLKEDSQKRTDTAMKKYIKSKIRQIEAFQAQHNPTFTQAERDKLRLILVNTEFERGGYTAAKLEGMKLAANFLLNQKGKEESYKAFFDGPVYDKECKRLLKAMPGTKAAQKRLHRPMHQRDKAFLAAIRSATPDSFFMIGKNHLIPSPDIDETNLRYLRSELRKFEDENPYAILAMK